MEAENRNAKLVAETKEKQIEEREATLASQRKADKQAADDTKAAKEQLKKAKGDSSTSDATPRHHARTAMWHSPLSLNCVPPGSSSKEKAREQLIKAREAQKRTQEAVDNAERLLKQQADAAKKARHEALEKAKEEVCIAYFEVPGPTQSCRTSWLKHLRCVGKGQNGLREQDLIATRGFGGIFWGRATVGAG